MKLSQLQKELESANTVDEGRSAREKIDGFSRIQEVYIRSISDLLQTQSRISPSVGPIDPDEDRPVLEVLIDKFRTKLKELE